MNARKHQEDLELPPITAAGVQRHRDRLLRLMASLSMKSSREDFKVVQNEVRNFWDLVYKASRLPEGEWFGIDTKRYFYELMQTEEHRNFDRVRTFFHHQTDSYKAWKKGDNKRRYDEQLRRERSTPEYKARSAALARRRRRRDHYEQVRDNLRSAILLGEQGPALQVLWDATEDAYEAVIAVEVPDFQGDGYGVAWAEVKVALTQKFVAEAAKVTPLHRKRIAEAPPERRLEDIMAGPEPTIQEIMEFLGEEP